MKCEVFSSTQDKFCMYKVSIFKIKLSLCLFTRKYKEKKTSGKKNNFIRFDFTIKNIKNIKNIIKICQKFRARLVVFFKIFF